MCVILVRRQGSRCIKGDDSSGKVMYMSRVSALQSNKMKVTYEHKTVGGRWYGRTCK